MSTRADASRWGIRRKSWKLSKLDKTEQAKSKRDTSPCCSSGSNKFPELSIRRISGFKKLALAMHSSQEDSDVPQRSYVLTVRVCVVLHCDSVCATKVECACMLSLVDTLRKTGELHTAIRHMPRIRTIYKASSNEWAGNESTASLIYLSLLCSQRSGERGCCRSWEGVRRCASSTTRLLLRASYTS
jgi:hypothetical protein